MPLVGGQHRQAVRGGRRRDGDVLEARIMGARPVEDRPGLTGFIDAEGQDTVAIEMLDGGQPAAQCRGLGAGADPDRPGDAGLDLGDGDRREIEPVVMGAHPGRESLGIAPRRRRGRENIGIEQVQVSEARIPQRARRLAGAFGNVLGRAGEGQQQIGEIRHPGDALPFLEGEQHRFLAAVPGDDRRLAGHGLIDHGGERRLRIPELEFLHGRLRVVTTHSHIVHGVRSSRSRPLLCILKTGRP